MFSEKDNYIKLNEYYIMKMVMRTIEIKQISYEVEEGRQEQVVKKLNELYPDLKVTLMSYLTEKKKAL